MKNWKTFVARVMFVFVWLFGGTALQVALWKSPDRTYVDALIRHPYLWIIYFLIAHLITEHCLRLMNRKS